MYRGRRTDRERQNDRCVYSVCGLVCLVCVYQARFKYQPDSSDGKVCVTQTLQPVLVFLLGAIRIGAMTVVIATMIGVINTMIDVRDMTTAATDMMIGVIGMMIADPMTVAIGTMTDIR